MSGFVFLRVRAHRLLLTAALLAVLLTTSVLAALTAFSGSIGDAGLRRSLGSRDAPAAALTISSGSIDKNNRPAADKVVAEAARRTFDGLPTRTTTLDQSGPYALPRTLQPPAARKGDPDLTRFAGVDPGKVRLVSGAWPKALPAGFGNGTVIEVALPDNAAKALKVTAGPTVLTLTDRLTGPPRTIRVTGLYAPKQAADPYWKLDELGGRGIRTGSFTTYGPLLADPALLRSGQVSQGTSAWLATADFRTVDSSRIDALRTASQGGVRYVKATAPFTTGAVDVAQGLPTLLDQAQRALLVARSTLMIVSLQLILLAAYALLLVARLLSAERSGETELLIARGGSRQRIVGLAAIEAVLLALPAALVAPLLAGPLTRLLSGQGALGRIGLTLETGGPFGSAGIWLVGVGVGLGCAAAVVAPAIAAGRTRKGRSVPAPMKAGADLALLLIAVVAYWQLDRQTSGTGPLTGDRTGELGVDPLLVAAPALALLAGTVLTLRLLPPLAKLAEKRAARGRSLPAALAGWQLGRRPLRGAGPVLLLVLAVAMGMLAIGQGASWDRSQEDQADFRSGASVRVLTGSRADSGQADAYGRIPGVRSVAPAARLPMPLSDGPVASVLALDTAGAGEALMLREDLVDGDSLTTRAEGLRVPEGERRTGVELPGGGASFTLDLGLRRSDGKPSTVSGTVIATVEDRFGAVHRLRAGRLAADGRRTALRVDTVKEAGPLAGPLYLTGLEMTLPQPFDTDQSLVLTLHRALGSDGKPVPAPAALSWSGTAVDPLMVRDGATDAVKTLTVQPVEGTLMEAAFLSGVDPAPPEERWEERTTTVRVDAVGTNERPLRALATDAFLAASGAKPGAEIDFDVHGERLTLVVAGTLKQLPTTGPATADADAAKADGGALLVDLRALNLELTRRLAMSVPPSEWWLGAAPGKGADIAASLRARPDIDPQQVLVRDETLRELNDDPLGAGPQAALLAVSVVAALLAAVGFAVGAAGSLRERTAEFAVLRALGTPSRQLARLIAAEQSLLIGIALVVGLALGAVLTRAIVPLIVLTGQATQPLPNVLVQLPAGQIALLLAGVVAVPLLVVLVLAVRRGDPATTLRVQGGGN
ncbi:ABC transporter permease [Streptomyces sp. NBC_00237]|uniref:ABC transporter permease n=1 Tax=Streptomyces sp. NBC_00237 TaxID=2975687 RepID=UPI00225826DC|nr:ABC transporter permease [Streptomyces sp. NBC_00237]MCX5201175.1 ABC transporter permease [Streptomyces sp. NBC_00237]